MLTLRDRSILVVGASGGLGSELAKLLAAAGANLILSGRDEVTLRALGIPGTVMAADLLDPTTPITLVATAIMVNGRLDGVVNAAGVVGFGTAKETADATINELFAVNTIAPMRLVRDATEALAESALDNREPFFVTISGVVSESPTAQLSAYSASKTALAAFNQVTARELRRFGIRLLDARPGHTETALASRAIAGRAPALPVGMSPAAVARVIFDAIVSGETDLPSTAFAGATRAGHDAVVYPGASAQLVPAESGHNL